MLGIGRAGGWALIGGWAGCGLGGFGIEWFVVVVVIGGGGGFPARFAVRGGGGRSRWLVWWALGMVTSGHPRVRDFEQLEATDYSGGSLGKWENWRRGH